MPSNASDRPNVLFCISDDQSWVHTSVEGDPVVKTPAFDRVAEEGVRFTHAFCAAPTCTASRGAVLTGRMFWALEEGGNLWSTLPARFPVYPDLLEEAGYHVGITRKGWGPGQHEPGGRTRNAAGPSYKSFGEFMEARPDSKPFCFWFGSHDPHRPYDEGSGLASGMNIDDVIVPPMLPDAREVRSDILDYFWEIQRYDRECGEMIALLEERGELDNTIVVITGDNGLPFPRAKANLYDWGTRMPLAVRWPAQVPGGRVVEDFISFTDFAPTFLEAAGLEPPPTTTGRSFLDVLESDESGRVSDQRNRVFTGRERHAWCREGLGYPIRSIRTHEYLYIRNFEPDRWPAGEPEVYRDIDGGPTKTYMMENREAEDVAPLFELAFGKRPLEELYDLREDPDQMVNVADLPKYADVKQRLWRELGDEMKATDDLRAIGGAELWDTCPYYGGSQPQKRG